GAVGALTEALALELAGDQILVNAVAPGPILPPPDLGEEERRAVERETPVGRWGGEEAIAHLVLALVESDFITGETVRADGGRHLRGPAPDRDVRCSPVALKTRRREPERACHFTPVRGRRAQAMNSP